MNSDESRGNYNFQHRKPNPHKGSYSPSSNYYGNTGYNNGQHPQHSQHPQNSHNSQQKRRPPQHKNFSSNNSNNNTDKLIKQNDMIIKLLKEIRDRLPAPQESDTKETSEESIQNVDLHGEDQVAPAANTDEDDIEDNDSGDDEQPFEDDVDDDALEPDNAHNK